jgi:hypothetical protein
MAALLSSLAVGVRGMGVSLLIVEGLATKGAKVHIGGPCKEAHSQGGRQRGYYFVRSISSYCVVRTLNQAMGQLFS